ncbi:MAG: tetratricopeptide repeat protein [Candidatus Latescibacterota bacterium]|nr:tetratricopeptide repeat protein [Candidatus Latescibacterota bacterium]
MVACGRSDTPSANASVDDLLTLAQRRLGEDDIRGAIGAYRMALARDSTNARALNELGRIFALQSRDEAAQRYLRRAFQSYYEQGVKAWEESRDTTAARAAFRLAARALPNHPLAALRVGEIAEAAGDFEGAIGHYELAVSVNPRFAQSYIKLGSACLAANRLDQARSAFSKAVELNINALDAYLGLGRLASLDENWAAAEVEFQKALLIDPDSPVATEGLKKARARL